MKCNKELLEFIKKQEGCRLKAYKCAGGKWTIGYGHTKNVKEGMTITQNQAEKFFIDDITEVEKQLDDLLLDLDREYSDYQYSSLVSFTFNLGIGNTKKLLQNRTNLHEIARAMLLYCKANKTILDGLRNRRIKESDYFLNYTLRPIEKVLYAIKPNYHIRKEPSISGEIIITYDFSVFVEVLGICGDWVSTNRGFIHKDAFYDNFQ